MIWLAVTLPRSREGGDPLEISRGSRHLHSRVSFFTLRLETALKRPERGFGSLATRTLSRLGPGCPASIIGRAPSRGSAILSGGSTC